MVSGRARRWQVTCACGWRARGTRDEVVAAVREHGRSAHNLELTDEQVMAQAVPDGPV
jgi:predicted small metal-binding protein